MASIGVGIDPDGAGSVVEPGSQRRDDVVEHQRLAPSDVKDAAGDVLPVHPLRKEVEGDFEVARLGGIEDPDIGAPVSSVGSRRLRGGGDVHVLRLQRQGREQGE
jgi:hypothetical protein